MCDSTCTRPRGRMIELSESVGAILAHDMTEIRPGEYKGPAFRKGHVVTKADLDHLARIGKRHLYILDMPADMMHEDEAALLMAEALTGDGVTFQPTPSEGKITLVAARDGLFKADVQTLTEFNMVEGVMCASRHTNTVVRQGETLAGVRAIPLVVARQVVDQAVSTARTAEAVFSVKPLAKPKVGLIITGNEVYDGLIKDKFGPVIRNKVEALGCPILDVIPAPDDTDHIARLINEFIDQGAGLLITTGGMSVDPDDVTRLGVLKAGAEDILYGSAVLPGAMLLLAKVRGVPLIGVPACGMYHNQTIFDLVLPRLLAGEDLTRRDLASLAHGGLCLDCNTCRFPRCSFGKAG